MTKLFTNLIIMSMCVAFLTSCSTLKNYDFKTAGIAATDSTYLVTPEGTRVNASTIEVNPNKVTVDGKPYPLDGIAYIKTKQMYFGVHDKKILLGEVYGKINVLYQLVSTPTYGSSTPNAAPGSFGYHNMVTGHNTSKKYYIQKNGSTIIDKMSPGIVLDYVSDNEEASQVAIGARNWKRGYLASWAGIVAGTVYAFKNLFTTETTASGSIKPVNFTGPFIVLGASVTGATLSSYMYNTQMMKAVEIYNR
ncbi:hypothetical protein KXQ82_05580 [Mucilaginibacter sp. HMF5004]|uniref:hypothetical protein n=1 Tax=Mucilaginibacter rivuli TaxID=2857527 RepID=UPI001C601A62|nr:hypothetical protein [Mucilaginibacter rivuli]MBW4889174.1 hypothetical protein [Mucilaginibacter rivuli]